MANLVSSLARLAQQFNLAGSVPEIEIKHVAISSQFVSPGGLFIAAPGAKTHGLEYLPQAIDNGAVALLTDRAGDYPLPSLIHPNPREIAGLLAAAVYETKESALFGVTGTNGKTSTSYYLHRLLQASGNPAGLISSAEQIIGGVSQSAELTTPEAPRLHQLIAQMRGLGESSCAVEVSAQALVRHRVDGLRFRVAGFSNLSRDHLDDFGDMQTYLEAKAKLFTEEFAQLAVVNIEDPWGQALFDRISIPKLSLGPGCDYQFQFESGVLSVEGQQSVTIDFDGGPLMAKNLALAATMLLAGDIPLPKRLTIDPAVPGRLQLVSNLRPHVYVDYAHTPAGVAAAVKELSAKYPSLTVVLGASGNRDRGKRSEMAQACAAAAQLIVTDQHPRDENPADIRADLIRAATESGIPVVELSDPAQAIAHAIGQTDQNGAVLWCGPGHLKYREIAGQKIAFDAIAEARKAQRD